MLDPFFFGYWSLKNTTNKRSRIIGHQSHSDTVPYARNINTSVPINGIKIHFTRKKDLKNLTTIPVFHKQHT
jgi:hypothetical protein